MILEACVGNFEEAINAEKLSAHQIELCDRLDLDGISPSLEVVKKVSTHLKIPTKVIINPNPYNYCYSSNDLEKIIQYITRLNELPIQGIVFGPLTKDGLPDKLAIRKISENTNLPITYHKAIDSTKDILESTRILLNQNIIQFILSSGGEKTAMEGAEQLLKMKSIVKNSEIQIIGAGKITADNLSQLHESTQLSYYHGKKIVGDLSCQVL